MTAYYNEIEPFAADWLENLIGAGLIAPGDVDRRDIRDVKPDDLRSYTQCHFFAGIGVWSYALRLAGWPDDRPVWTGSCPCQPFSAAGRGKGTADERHLWPHWFHLVGECAPPIVFGEQVASKDGLGWLDLVQADLEGAGYAVGAADICAAGVGAPHIRQRLWFGAVAGRSAAGVEHADGERLERRADESVGAQGRQSSLGPAGLSGGRAGRMADADRARPFSGTHAGVHCGEEGTGPRHGEPERPRSDGRMADADRQVQSGRGVQGSGESNRAGARATLERSPRLRADGRMADADSRERGRGPEGEGRLCDREAPGWEQGDRRAEPGGAVGGVGDSPDQPRERVSGAVLGAEAPQHGARQPVDGAEHLRPEYAGEGVGERPRPTNGFWRDADWLLCRDGKWRPVEPCHVEMADGLAAAVGPMCAIADLSGEEAGERMQALRDTFGEEEIQRQAGGQWRVSEARILRSLVHGGLDGRPDEDRGREEQPAAVGEDSIDALRDVREKRHEAGCASPGREPDEQRSAQLDDVVRLLPCSLSLAELHGRRDAAESLCFLQRAIREERGLPNASESLEAAWASLGEEAKGRIGMGFDASRWRVVAPFPLSHGAVSRVGRLRAYGNAIVPQVAATFVAAFVESCESI